MNVRGLFGCKVVMSRLLPKNWLLLMSEATNERGELAPRFQLFVMEPPLRGDPNVHDGPHPARPGECARCDVLEGPKR